MARMIDADRLLRELTALSHGGETPGWTYEGLRLLIERQPTLTQPNEPLTLEELREMDGQPVWVENKSNPYLNGWGIMLENICSAYHGIFDVEEYGKTWLAYAYPPVHIDIEAWEACEFCKRADFGEFGFEISKHYAKISCALASWRFPKEEQFSYCPKCGKPLSEEAWQELEKRVRGEK